MRGPFLFAVLMAGTTGIASGHEAAHSATAAPVNLIRSAQSGAWSAATTWEGGAVPGAGARVQVREGHTVTYDMDCDTPIRMIHVAGTLTFDPDRNTRLDVGLIKIQAGDDASEEGFDCEAHLPDGPTTGPRPTLEVGTQDEPIRGPHKALIRLIDCDGVDKNSWPAIVCCGGRMDFHGMLMLPWCKLAEPAKAGDETIVLQNAAFAWQPGDRVIVTTTKPIRSGSYDRDGSETEERLVTSVIGKSVVLDRPLEYDHACDGEFRGEAANLSRNVVVESADPAKARGHTMYHRGSAGSISYAEFRHLGKENVLGRYALHYHLVGDTMRGSSVIGASIWDSANRWLTIHGTNYLVVRACVGYRSIGHGFFLEDGSEAYNVLDNNLAVGAVAGKPLKGQVLPFDLNDGAGFWWANNLNTFTRNVACDNEEYGYRFDATAKNARRMKFNTTFDVLQPDGSRQSTDVRTLPFVRFEDNECHSDGLYGMNLGEGVDRVGPDERHPLIVRNMKIWATHYALRPQAPCVLLDNVHIHKCNYGIYHPDYDRHVYRNLTISETPSEPFSSGFADAGEQYGVLTVDGLVVKNFKSPGKSMPIKLSHYNKSGAAESHFRNVKLEGWSGANGLVGLVGGKWLKPSTPVGCPIYLHDWFGPNRHAKIVSRHAEDLMTDGGDYREVATLTGEESRAAEVSNVEFPQLLDPVDDRAPTTVITYVGTTTDGKQWIVHGTTTDDGEVKRVVVNGLEARSLIGNFAEWGVLIDRPADGACTISAQADDASGNIEKRPHVVTR